MADFRNIHTRIWTDSWFCELAPDEKLMFVYLFSNPNASVCGMYEMPKRNISMDTGLSLDRVSEILDTFTASGKVYYERGIVWVVNLKKYNDSGDSSKIRVRISKDLAALPDCELKRMYFEKENIPYPGMDIPYPEKMSEKRQKGEETEGDGESTPPAHSQDWKALSPDTIALQVYSRVTGFMSIPSALTDQSTLLWQFAKDKKGIDLAADYLRPFYSAWTLRKTKDGRFYSKTSGGWLDWAIAGEIPKSDNGHKTRGRGVPEV